MHHFIVPALSVIVGHLHRAAHRTRPQTEAPDQTRPFDGRRPGPHEGDHGRQASHQLWQLGEWQDRRRRLDLGASNNGGGAPGWDPLDGPLLLPGGAVGPMKAVGIRENKQVERHGRTLPTGFLNTNKEVAQQA